MAPAENEIYIRPTLHIHPNLAAAKEFTDTYGAYYFWSDKKSVSISDAALGKRNLIIGEPGVGKTLLLTKIQEHLNSIGISTCLISLKYKDLAASLSQFLDATEGQPKALLLDGLDEVRGNLFPLVLQKIEEISHAQPGISIFLSSRSIFAYRYAALFSDYRIITVSPFTQSQVTDYLVDAGNPRNEVEAFLERFASSNPSLLVIQIPRYLFLLSQFLKKNEIRSVERLSRNQLFEYFIYSKLDLEDEKFNRNSRSLTKRFLEKMALTMEIYQSNAITHDEFMTVLDDLHSDIKLATFAQVDLQDFFDTSLLKDNHDSLEFDNVEFQEYLAAKEIARFPDPKFTAFSLAVEPTLNELHPSWFNALTFLVDMHGQLVESIIEFSGIRGDRVVDEAFLNFLGRINMSSVPSNLRVSLFLDVFNYHQRLLQWLPLNLAALLASLFDSSLETTLRAQSENANKETEARRFVPLGNIALLVGQLFKNKANIDREYWTKQLVKFVSDQNDNGVLQRYALHSLKFTGDPKVLSDLPSDLVTRDELLSRAFLALCTELDPEAPRSLESFFEATLTGQIDARYGFYALKHAPALKAFLTKYIADPRFRQTFLEKASVFKEQDAVIVEHIRAVADDELLLLSQQAIVASLQLDTAHDAKRSHFVLSLGRFLKCAAPSFLTQIIDQIVAANPQSGLFFASDFFAAILEEMDLPTFAKAMSAAGQDRIAFNVLQLIRSSGKDGAEKIFEAGRALLPAQYDQWDEWQRSDQKQAENAYNAQVLSEFKTLLEPAPGQYSPAVFAFYLQNAKIIEPSLIQQDRDRLLELVGGSVFSIIDPANYSLTAVEIQQGHATTYTVSGHIDVFGSALLVADRLRMDITKFRQRIINFIPFAYSDHLSAILRLCPDISVAELKAVIDTYIQHKSDLWRHQPGSFIYVVERHHIKAAVPVLQMMARESQLSASTRIQAMIVAESLAPDKLFLQKLANNSGSESQTANEGVIDPSVGLLIAIHSDPTAIRRRLSEILTRVMPFVPVSGVHPVSSLEEELTGGRGFASPLFKVRVRGFEDDYLRLLDRAMELWPKGKEFYPYSTYLWDIVYAYFDNLKESGSFEPLQILERKVASLKDTDGSNWLAARMSKLRRSYLAFLGKPQNIAEAIQKYNIARVHDNKKIANSNDLIYQLREVIEKDLKQWIQSEGAYDMLLTGKLYKAKHQPFEKLLQKTIKSQLENALMKRGFQTDVIREPQLLDEKRTDFLIRYGFAGPVVLEIKLTSNADMQTPRPETSASFKSMQRYMEGYGASHGIFLVVDNKRSKHLSEIKSVFQSIRNVWVIVIDSRQELIDAKASLRKKVKRRSARRKRKSG
jgi:hypothetical protein